MALAGGVCHMISAVVMIGNSDDKLSQADWAQYVADIQTIMNALTMQIHGTWFSPSQDPWQNAAWCVDVADLLWEKFCDQIHTVRTHYVQDAVAILAGTTQFI